MLNVIQLNYQEMFQELQSSRKDLVLEIQGFERVQNDIKDDIARL